MTGGSKSSTDASVTRSAPQIYNATFVGAGPGITGSDKGNNAFLLDDYFAANVQNSVFHDFAEAFVEVKSDGEGGFSASNNTIGAFGDYDGANNGSVLDAPVAFLGSNPFFSVTGTPINGHTNAGTDPGFSAYTRDGSGYLTSIDPRPATDSSPRTDDVSAGAPAAAAYRGAFGDTNWLLGWTWADAQGLVADAFVAEPLVPATDVDVIASQTAFDAFYGVNVLTGSTTWTSDKIYILTDRVYVKEDQVLTIEPGTKVYGTFDDNGTAGNFSDDKVGAVIVARGGQLVADGTLEAPIVFDAIQSLEAVRGEDHPWDVDAVAGPAPTRETGGLWGGLIMLGSAYIAHTDSNGVNIGNNIIEGFLPATAVDNDSAVSYTHLTLPTICSV